METVVAGLVAIFSCFLRAYCDPLNDGLILLEPSPGPVLSPYGSSVEINCTTTPPFIFKRWNFIFKPSNNSYLLQEINSELVLSSDNSTHLQLLLDKGISVTAINESFFSEVTVAASEASSHLCFVECEAVNVSGPSSVSVREGVNVTIYGPPPCPTHFTLVELGVNCVVLYWYSLFEVTGTNLRFTLAVVTIGHYFTRIEMIKSILTNYYVYSMDGRSSSPCDLYLFQVTAVNDAGEGYPSDVIMRNLPSLPDVSRVSRSVRHSLTKTPLGVALSLGFYGATTCPDHPVLLYYLLLHNLNTQTLEVQILQGLEDSHTYLEENSRYLYYIFASNSIGIMGTRSIEIVTTDIQAVEVYATSHAYHIRCVYLNHTDIPGCVYTLVSEVEGVGNVTGVIERQGDGEGVTVHVELNSVGCYSRVLACPWDGSDNFTFSIVNESLCVSRSVHNSVDCLQLRGFNLSLALTAALVFPLVQLFWVFCLIYTGLLDPCTCGSVWICWLSDQVGYRELLSSDDRVEQVEEQIHDTVRDWESTLSSSDVDEDEDLLHMYPGYPRPRPTSFRRPVPHFSIHSPRGRPYYPLRQLQGSGRVRLSTKQIRDQIIREACLPREVSTDEEHDTTEMTCITLRSPPVELLTSNKRANTRMLCYTPRSPEKEDRTKAFLRITLSPTPKYLVFIRGEQRKIIRYNPVKSREQKYRGPTQVRVVYIILKPALGGPEDKQTSVPVNFPPLYEALYSLCTPGAAKVKKRGRLLLPPPLSMDPSTSIRLMKIHAASQLPRNSKSWDIFLQQMPESASFSSDAEHVEKSGSDDLTSSQTELDSTFGFPSPFSVPEPISSEMAVGSSVSPPIFVTPASDRGQFDASAAPTSGSPSASASAPHQNLTLHTGTIQVPEWEHITKRRRKLELRKRRKRSKASPMEQESEGSCENATMQLLFLPSLPPVNSDGAGVGQLKGTSRETDVATNEGLCEIWDTDGHQASNTGVKRKRKKKDKRNHDKYALGEVPDEGQDIDVATCSDSQQEMTPEWTSMTTEAFKTDDVGDTPSADHSSSKHSKSKINAGTTTAAPNAMATKPFHIRSVPKDHLPPNTKVLLVATDGDEVRVGVPVVVYTP